eukprot:4427418-Lingulodinium_polyedra.AAC.1
MALPVARGAFQTAPALRGVQDLRIVCFANHAQVPQLCSHQSVNKPTLPCFLERRSPEPRHSRACQA